MTVVVPPTPEDQEAANHSARMEQLRRGEMSVLPATIAAMRDDPRQRSYLDYDVAKILAEHHAALWNDTLLAIFADQQERKKADPDAFEGYHSFAQRLHPMTWMTSFVCDYLLPNGLPTGHMRLFREYRDLASRTTLPLEFRLGVMRLYKFSAIPASTALELLRHPAGREIVRAKLTADMFQTLYRSREVGHVIACLLFFPETHAFLTKSQRDRMPCLEELPKLADYQAGTPLPVPVASLLIMYGWRLFKESASRFLEQVTGVSSADLRSEESEVIGVTWPASGTKARVARGTYVFSETGILVENKKCFWRCGESNILLGYHGANSLHQAVEADLAAKGYKLVQWRGLCTRQYFYTPTPADILTNLYHLISSVGLNDIEFNEWLTFLPHLGDRDQVALFPILNAMVSARGAQLYAGEMAGVSHDNRHTTLTTEYLIPRGIVPPPYMTATLA